MMISCIIPAAGTSSRMEEWKLLLPLDGIPLIFHVIEALLPLQAPVCVVTGFRGSELQQRLSDAYPVLTFTENPDFSLGMFSSLQRGLSRIEHGSVLIQPADMPLVRSSHMRKITELWLKHPEGVLRPRHGITKKPGHPVICDHRTVRHVLRQDPTGSMQQHIAGFAHRYLETEDPAWFTDIDTPKEYQRLTL